MNGHIRAATSNPETKLEINRDTGGNDTCAAHGQENRDNTHKTRCDCTRVRPHAEDNQQDNQESRQGRRFRVEENRPGNDTDTRSCDSERWNNMWNSGCTQKYTSDVPKSTHREKTEALGTGCYAQQSSRGKGKKGRANARQQRKDATNTIAKQYASELKDKATKAETKFKDFLDRYGFKYIFQKPFKQLGSFSIADFYLPQFATVIEIDGGYHDTREQKARDDIRTKNLMKINNIKSVVRYTNDEVFGDEKAILKRLCLAILPQAEGILAE